MSQCESYTLVGTSGYPASDTLVAPAEVFSTSMQINHGYFGFSGDLEARASGQTSNPINVPDACRRAVTPSREAAPAGPTKPTVIRQ
jgi:hypothetical protein